MDLATPHAERETPLRDGELSGDTAGEAQPSPLPNFGTTAQEKYGKHATQEPPHSLHSGSGKNTAPSRKRFQLANSTATTNAVTGASSQQQLQQQRRAEQGESAQLKHPSTTQATVPGAKEPPPPTTQLKPAPAQTTINTTTTEANKKSKSSTKEKPIANGGSSPVKSRVATSPSPEVPKAAAATHPLGLPRLCSSTNNPTESAKNKEVQRQQLVRPAEQDRPDSNMVVKTATTAAGASAEETAVQQQPSAKQGSSRPPATTAVVTTEEKSEPSTKKKKQLVEQDSPASRAVAKTATTNNSSSASVGEEYEETEALIGRCIGPGLDGVPSNENANPNGGTSIFAVPASASALRPAHLNTSTGATRRSDLGSSPSNSSNSETRPSIQQQASTGGTSDLSKLDSHGNAKLQSQVKNIETDSTMQLQPTMQQQQSQQQNQNDSGSGGLQQQQDHQQSRGSGDDLLSFLSEQKACFKCPVEDFYEWLISEDIATLSDLALAVQDEEFSLCGGGLKKFKLATFEKLVLSAAAE